MQNAVLAGTPVSPMVGTNIDSDSVFDNLRGMYDACGNAEYLVIFQKHVNIRKME